MFKRRHRASIRPCRLEYSGRILQYSSPNTPVVESEYSSLQGRILGYFSPKTDTMRQKGDNGRDKSGRRQGLGCGTTTSVLHSVRSAYELLSDSLLFPLKHFVPHSSSRGYLCNILSRWNIGFKQFHPIHSLMIDNGKIPAHITCRRFFLGERVHHL